jgi:murein DD-endopeptidase MepM/ murein hydrolase activator NlpD
MPRKISFVVLTHTGAPARQFCAPRWAVRGAAVLAALVLAGIGAAGVDYLQLKRHAFKLQSREEEVARLLAGQREEAELQKRHIGGFAQEINGLRERLLALNQFEQKIRVMTDLDRRVEPVNLFGVGGSPPAALDPEAAMSGQRASMVREMYGQIRELHLAAARQESGFKGLVAHLEKQRSLLAATPTIRPLDPEAEYWESSRFDWRTSPFTNQREFHKGFDLAAREGTPILATAAGVVIFAGNKGPLGKTVVIDHGHGISTVYGHCSKIFKLPGERVGRWDTIALVGNTGSSTGPHLHYEVQLHGVPVNPEKYILN